MESQIYYSNTFYFDIRNYTKIKESQIFILKLDILPEGKCKQFDYFSRLIKRIPNIKELEISIDVKLQREKNQPQQKIKEILDFLVDAIIPQYQDTLEIITFTQINIQENSEKDEEQTIKKYLLKLLKPLKALRTISFRQNTTEVQALNFYGLKQFVILLKEKSLNLPNLKLLDFEFKQTQNQVHLKSFNQKDVQNTMLAIAKDLSKTKQIEELQMCIQNLGLEKIFFEHLMSSIIEMKNLKKLGLDISGNRINVENSVKNIKQLQILSSQLENFIYIDSQNFKPSNIKEFNQIMRTFENLKFLQIEQFSFKQGHCDEFFQFLSFMPQLQEIKLDLENMIFNDNDYNYFAKQIKQLDNLTSIELTLPPEKQFLSENTVLNLVDIITHFQSKLLDLSVLFNSDIQTTDSELLIEAITKLENLMYIHFRLQNKRQNNSLEIDARKQKAKNIWNLQSAKFYCRQDRFINTQEILIFLNQRIVLNQNNLTLTEFKIIQQTMYVEKLDIQIHNKFMEGIGKYSNLKSLFISSNTTTAHLEDLNKVLFSNNSKTLIDLDISHYDYIRQPQLLNQIQNCKLLYQLDLKTYNINNQILESLFNELIYLQKVNITQNFKILIDQKIFQNANYLTDFRCAGAQNQDSIKIVSERKVFILQNLIYSQIIQPEIIYQPQFSHLDIIIN